MADLIPREFIALLLAKVDIVEVISAFLPLHKKSNNNYFACCPFHQEKTASFSVSQVKQFYYCFGCGAHGNAIDFFMQRERLSFPEAVDVLARRVGVEIPKTAAGFKEKKENFAELHQLLEKVSEYYRGQLRQSPAAIQYLKQRGIDGITAKQFGLGFSPPGWTQMMDHFAHNETELKRLYEVGLIIKKDKGGYYDRFRERIIFPITDYRGRMIGFGARVIKQEEPKYLNSPDTSLFQKGHELYGLHAVLTAHPRLEQVVLVEGYMDVIALFQSGITYAVAALGTATTAYHLQRLFRYTSKLIFCFDGDQAGRMAAWRALLVVLPCLHQDQQVRFLFLPDGEDPDSLVRKEGKQGFEKRLTAAISLSAFFFQTLSQQNELSSLEGRARFAAQALSHIKTLPDGLFQRMMLDELSKRARIEPAELKRQLGTPHHTQVSIHGLAAIPWSSLLQRALGLLIQYPALAVRIAADPAEKEQRSVTVQSISELVFILPGMEVLIQILVLAQAQPNLTTAMLLEHWRGKPEQAWLAALAQRDYLIPESGIESEFLGAIKQLTIAAYEERIKPLLAKAAGSDLLEIEKIELAEWISKKKTLATE